MSSLKEEILELEKEARKLEPNISTMNKWNTKVMNYGIDFVESIYDRNAYDPDYLPSKEIESIEIEETPKDIEELLQVLYTSVDNTGINPASGGHLGYIPGGGIYPSGLADYLADVTNRYAGIYYANPGAVRMENLLIRWMADLIGYPKTAVGNLASGGSIANLMAVTAARDSKGIVSNVVPKAVIYITEQTHHCIHKAIRIAGLNESVIRNVPLDENYRMDSKELEKMIREDHNSDLIPFFVVASLGSTDTGVVDPIDEISGICEKWNCWFHIDAAYGGFFILVDELKDYFKGVEKSDSFVIDPHKTLFLPYGLGAILVRDPNALLSSHYYRANYMQDTFSEENQISPADLSPELTKHFRGLRMWLPLQLFGLEAFRACIKEKWKLCLYFYEQVMRKGFEVGPEPELSVCMFRYLPENIDANEFNKMLAQEIRKDGRIFISSTTVNGIYWLRVAIVCFRTHLNVIELFLDILVQKKNELLSL